MRSVVQIVTPAASELLTTLSRVKGELRGVTGADEEVLKAKIAEASSDVQAAMGYRLPSEDVIETFWHDDVTALPRVVHWRNQALTTLFLSRTPVSTIASVTVDDVPLDTTDFLVDPKTGTLDRFSSGFPCEWWFCKSVVVTYTGGFVLPGNPGRNLDFGIEGAVVALVADYWASRGRDPTLMSESIPGVRDVRYWVGAVGDPELLPPRVLASLSQFRRPMYAVA
jgi:hypothetical protein